MYILTKTVPEAFTANALDEVKLFGRMPNDTTEDALITDMISSVEDVYQKENGLQLVTATYRMDIQFWPGFENQNVSVWGKQIPITIYNAYEYQIILPILPAKAIVSLKYYDGTNTLQTVDSSLYSLIVPLNGQSKLCLSKNFTFPSLFQRQDAIQITFTAGFGNREDVPPAIRTEIKAVITYLYENRQAYSDKQTFTMPVWNRLGSAYRNWGY